VSYDPTTVEMGKSTVATVLVTNTGNGDSEADMPMVEFAIPPGFEVDFGPLDEQVDKDPNVARYDLKGDRVLIYLHRMPPEAGSSFEFTFPLQPRFPMEIETPPSATYPFYEPNLGSESTPSTLVVTGV